MGERNCNGMEVYCVISKRRKGGVYGGCRSHGNRDSIGSSDHIAQCRFKSPCICSWNACTISQQDGVDFKPHLAGLSSSLSDTIC